MMILMPSKIQSTVPLLICSVVDLIWLFQECQVVNAGLISSLRLVNMQINMVFTQKLQVSNMLIYLVHQNMSLQTFEKIMVKQVLNRAMPMVKLLALSSLLLNQLGANTVSRIWYFFSVGVEN